MDYETIALELVDGVLTLTLDRPDQMNAFTVRMADELEHAFRWASQADAVKAVIVTGSGRAFCAGMDLSVGGNAFGLDESLEPTLEDLRDRLDDPVIARGVRDTGGRVALAIFDCAKPVIAAINGAAVGIGATMTLPMDVRLASTNARIGFIFGRIGITPEACSTWFLPRLVGLPRALQWLYSADILTAQEATDGGLVQEMLEPEELLPRARALAHKLVDRRSSVSLALIRQMIYRNAGLPHPRMAHEIESLAMFYTSIGDGKEGVRAFLEKREPEFTRSVSDGMPPFYHLWKD